MEGGRICTTRIAAYVQHPVQGAAASHPVQVARSESEQTITRPEQHERKRMAVHFAARPDVDASVGGMVRLALEGPVHGRLLQLNGRNRHGDARVERLLCSHRTRHDTIHRITVRDRCGTTRALNRRSTTAWRARSVPWPASSRRTLTLGSSDRREASTHPALPPPTTTKSKRRRGGATVSSPACWHKTILIH
jgi:hypothetical protein